MFPIDSFINLPAAPLGAVLELNPQRGIGRFNRSGLLNARVRPSEDRSKRKRVLRSSRAGPRAGPASWRIPRPFARRHLQRAGR